MANRVLRKKLRIGDKFGMLTVLSEVESRFYNQKRDGYLRRTRRVMCKCDCGVEIIRDYDTLPKQVKRGQISNCGCNNNKVKEITKDVTLIPNAKNLPRSEKREILIDLINKDYMNKEITLKTGFSGSFISQVRAEVGKLTFTINKSVNIGEKYNRVTIIKRVGNPDNRHIRVIGECECGTLKEFRLNHLITGNVKSCGCLLIERSTDMMKNQLLPNNIKHGDVKKTSKHNYLYRAWLGMKQRCYNPNNKRYSTYGERGITVYEPWINDYVKFKDWMLTNLGERKVSDTGKRSDNESLDRIDVNKGYHPDNLRWADFLTQANNKSINTTGHKTRPVVEKETGVRMLSSPKLKSLYEEYYGVKIKKGNVIHHINWDASDNSKENLIEVDRREHGWLHQTINYELRDKTHIDIVNTLKTVDWVEYSNRQTRGTEQIL